MNESSSFEIKFENIQRSEIQRLNKSNAVLTAIFCMLFCSGLPAMLICQLFVHLNIAAILHIPLSTKNLDFLFKIFYIAGIATMVPFWILGASSLLGQKLERLGSSFSITPEGVAWKTKNLVTRVMVHFNRTANMGRGRIDRPVGWDEILLIAAAGDSFTQLQKQYFPNKEIATWIPTASIFFVGEDKTTGKICMMAKVPIPEDLETSKRMLAVLKELAPQIPITQKCMEVLLGSAIQDRDLKYTEIWLKLMDEKSAQRVRQSELMENDILNEGRYRIHKKLATGGQANLYLATDLETGAKVVLKEYIVSSVTDNSIMNGLLEFETESGIMSRINQSNICQLLDMFVEDVRAYLVLEYIQGESLRARVERHGALSESETLQIAKQICQSVAFLHGMDPAVIHQDISPDNLLLSKNEIKLIDFSVATMGESYKVGQIAGKPAYMSVEQFRGVSKKSNDIYSIGATLYFLLVGKDPEPVSISQPKEEREELSDGIDAFVARCTSSGPEQFESAHSALAALEQLIEADSLSRNRDTLKMLTLPRANKTSLVSR
ncbi:MAG: serine/threonine protein kinase [Candidatus Obscuribacterales bacterium]|nr:serine/threonine protein kinase [Candidatus Obscuribacterales bacterium]